ncbi:MAG: SagB/ThcOx family dehydrogenase [cyanobacterium endosymbiont of Rhopalodia musculus]|uniref:SagB/ThcOx family dehydrogenase n=1 Tax=cyanobacterium endosymbiont of Epithemia clementina EcSB TaxID=3034674 RepID=UPI002481919F|nr:SagB/ThcOx family dehydrogenase [cyanobacterium endosymbiont of Epithemia clementina EcSB]WGT66911.1 SagB/ThcOx family dehydrogenase [cyanobacterium endosymbiont of Epithemia clementina EcSB]
MSYQLISIATHYHERTKYHPETIATKNKGLDWSKQPSVSKKYKVGNSYDLTTYLSDKYSQDELAQQWRRLSRLLACSYGVTAKVATMGTPLYLRTAPSAGGLYPAEVYLISRGTSLLPSGLYNYQSNTHSLINFWESDVWSDLQEACFEDLTLKDTQLAIITTAIFERSAWRYEDRAYRRIMLDTGHLLGNIELGCAINQYRPHLIGGFVDQMINRILYLDSDQEAAITVISLQDISNGNHISFNPPKTTIFPSEIHTDYPPIDDGELLSYFHQATEIRDLELSLSSTLISDPSHLEDKYNFPFCLKVSTETSPIDWNKDLINLENTILKRRSTRAYTGENLTLNELKSLLNFTYQSQDYKKTDLDPNPDYFDLELIETFIAISGVTGLEEGCYYYAPKAQELRQIRFKNFRQELHYLCLGQNLGRDAGALVFHTADLQKAVAKYGDRAYRYLHLDAGHLGQRLNLAAIYLNLGVSGIGGFFDDQVNEVLGIPPEEAVLYITTLGRPQRRN